MRSKFSVCTFFPGGIIGCNVEIYSGLLLRFVVPAYIADNSVPIKGTLIKLNIATDHLDAAPLQAQSKIGQGCSLSP